MPRFYPHGAAAPEDGLPPFLIVTGLGAWAYQDKAEAMDAYRQLIANGTSARLITAVTA